MGLATSLGLSIYYTQPSSREHSLILYTSTTILNGWDDPATQPPFVFCLMVYSGGGGGGREKRNDDDEKNENEGKKKEKEGWAA